MKSSSRRINSASGTGNLLKQVVADVNANLSAFQRTSRLRHRFEPMLKYTPSVNYGRNLSRIFMVQLRSELSLRTNGSFWRYGMSTVTIDIQPRVRKIEFVDDKLSVAIEDGRIVLVPLAWYPRLLHATEEERNDWRVFEDSDGRDIIFWEQLDELIPAIALLAGVPSRESQRSFERWLDSRKD
jgi:hypothetical protein